jgi:hypothetical protein
MEPAWLLALLLPGLFMAHVDTVNKHKGASSAKPVGVRWEVQNLEDLCPEALQLLAVFFQSCQTSSLLFQEIDGGTLFVSHLGPGECSQVTVFSPTFFGRREHFSTLNKC